MLSGLRTHLLNMFVETPKNEEWCALVDRFRQIYNFRNLIIGLQIDE
jgi:hypothetical protein